jgi:hypothetical protein
MILMLVPVRALVTVVVRAHVTVLIDIDTTRAGRVTGLAGIIFQVTGSARSIPLKIRSTLVTGGFLSPIRIGMGTLFHVTALRASNIRRTRERLDINHVNAKVVMKHGVPVAWQVTVILTREYTDHGIPTVFKSSF